MGSGDSTDGVPPPATADAAMPPVARTSPLPVKKMQTGRRKISAMPSTREVQGLRTSGVVLCAVLVDAAEQQILQMARLQAQRDEETGRLRLQVGIRTAGGHE